MSGGRVKYVTPAEAETIIRRKAEGASNREIAAEVGRSAACISAVLQRAGETVAQPKPLTEPAVLRARTRRIRELELENKRLRASVESREEFTAMLRETIEQVSPIKVPVPPVKARSRHKISQFQLFGDWHVGLTVEAREVEGWNSYNWEVCQRRAWRIAHAMVRWAVDEGKHTIADLHVAFLGDMINGMLRDESMIYDEFEPPIQVTKCAYLMTEILRYLAGHFPSVRVVALATDNHSRLTKKPFSQGRGRWSLGWSVNEFTRTSLEKVSNVSFINEEAVKTIIPVCGFRFLAQHGNDIKGGLNVSLPFYGFRKALGNEALARMHRPDMGFDYMVTAHYHDAFWVPWHFGNGSLCGISAHDKNQIRYSVPTQLGMLVHPKYGVFNLTPFLGDEDAMRRTGEVTAEKFSE